MAGTVGGTGAGGRAIGRLESLDFFRGLTMLLLVGESTLIYDVMVSPPFAGTWLAALGVNFLHHPWHGLRFWDLIQPFFMFIVGVAMPFAFCNRAARGGDAGEGRSVLRRALLLLLFGMLIYIYSAERIVFQYWNVLAQLAFAYPVTWLVMRTRWSVQFAVSLALIVVPELLYRFAAIPGFDQPFTPDRNFGTWVDFMAMGWGTFEGGHWVIFNALGTSAHTIWGMMAGTLLISDRDAARKIVVLLAAGLSALAVGFALDPLTPIIKRIATSSFVFASGGWALIALAICYWVIDVRQMRRYTLFARVVGMNSLFIFLFCNLGGSAAVQRLVLPFTRTIFAWGQPGVEELARAIGAWALLWGLCYWMYRRRIFISI